MRHGTNFDQLNTFLGLTFNHDDRFWIIWAANVRCQIADVLFNEEFNLTKDFSESFLRDIFKVDCVAIHKDPTQGLQFLHESCQIAHGALNTHTTLVTQYWSVRLSEFGMNAMLEDLSSRAIIECEPDDVQGKIATSQQIAIIPDVLHVAPELLTSEVRRRDKIAFPATFLGDIYAAGCLMYEIASRQRLINKDDLVKQPSEWHDSCTDR